jgi:hypothetical protein
MKNLIIIIVPLIQLTLSPAFGSENIFDQSPSCHKTFIDERNENSIMAGAMLIPLGLTPVMPLLILADLVALPLLIVGTTHAIQANNMANLIEQAYQGSGSLLDELVEDVQDKVPTRTREEIIAELIKFDQTLVLCPQYARPPIFKLSNLSFSDTVKELSRTATNPVAMASQIETKNILVESPTVIASGESAYSAE